MCGIRNFDKKTRRLYSAANLCLVAGLLPVVLDLSPATHHTLFKAIRGVLLGVSIGLFLLVQRPLKAAPPTDRQA